MKTQKNTTLRIVTLPFAICIAILAGLTILGSCQSKKNNETTTQIEVKPPQIDIHTAVLTENLQALNQHIAAGTNINERDPFGGSSPLISAAVFGRTDMAKVLIDAGADINFQNNDGSTALHSSAFFCYPDIVKMLLDKGADKTIKNRFGVTAYESMAVPFADVKSSYDMMGKILGPMGLKLDYPHIEKTRPEIAAMLK